jgi:hypothetical protein
MDKYNLYEMVVKEKKVRLLKLAINCKSNVSNRVIKLLEEGIDGSKINIDQTYIIGTSAKGIGYIYLDSLLARKHYVTK